ncbi:hypothetical protein C453_17289 [Haloferax elongans ATCC BAA-1513]|uniref:Uncharacterized protein n=1 Tax=Haloferax elongans ATCC BAA-1513 TaxID=1230453 RepID=M0HDH7_HALEO|nr:metal-dependent hydrolase [Haloferax elongans]ELZ81792.1 hypothetical protein C453_17289 [Haloferax elongans ATCC BAA-1513]
MGDYSEHLRAAILAGVVLAGIAGYVLYSREYSVQMVSVGSAVMFGLVVVLGIAPDIDVSSSIPRRYLGYVLVGSLPAGALYMVYTDPSIAVSVGEQVLALVGLGDVPPVVIGCGVLVVGAVGLAKSAGYGLDELSTHRGLLHSVYFWAVLGIVAAGAGHLYLDLPRVIAAVIVVASVAGPAVHIKVVDRM